MSRYDDLIADARLDRPILIDGGTGSECLRRGVPESDNGWSGAAALTHPDIVGAIHADYLALGAQVITANTFATGANIMRDIGAPEHFDEVNRRAVEIAIDMRERAGASAARVVVAAGVSNWSFSGNRPDLVTLRHDTATQAAIMREAGAELVILEMMVDIPRMTATLEGASTAELPIWVGFSLGPEEGCEADEIGDPIELREGGRLTDAVAVAAAYPAVDAMVIMHSDVRVAERGVQALRRAWPGPIGVWAHASALIDGRIVHDGIITPRDYASYVPDWLAAGATMIGGCCGIGPSHIAEIAPLVNRADEGRETPDHG